MSNDIPSKSPSRRVPWICLLLAVLTVGTFYPVLRCGFVNWDDMEHVARNPDMNPPTFHALERYWAKPYFGLWAPVTYSAWLATAAVAHGNPAVFHALNLAVHVAAVVLVFLIVRRLVPGIWPAAVGAAVFAVHPIQVEAIAWVSGLRDVLSGALAVLAIWMYLRATESTGPPRTWRCLAATAVFALALLSKPTAVVTPLMLAIILGRRWRSSARWLAAWVIMAAAISVIAFFAQPSSDVYRPPIWARPLVALDALSFYLRKLLLPAHLVIDYGRSPDWLMSHPAAWWPAGVVAAILVALTLYRQKIPRMARAAAIGICALLPVLGLVPFNFQYYSTVADRYAYLAMLGVALGVAAVIAAIPRWTWPFTAIIVAALGAASNRQTRLWQDTASLCDHTLTTNPGSVAALRILTFEARTHGQWPLALQYNDRALQTKPNDPLLIFDRANTLRAAGRLAAAAQAYFQALRLRPHDPQFRNNYAVLLAQQGNDAEAAAQFAEVLRQAPDYAEARANWATYLARHGNRDQALAEFRRALADDPGCAAAVRGIKALEGKSEIRNSNDESNPKSQ
ncbi:MAG TPA: tetratricopeptide repeat protein [Tepidisphaeraceae bacterium]|jgi:Tfp pilus assembly protein PilF|nr:tetratricopeptide repeat protein [Tepidisphaeraceae bacterium]